MSEIIEDQILKSPCRYCGYKSRGYWQAGTHDKNCPFYKIGGMEERKKWLLKQPDQDFPDYTRQQVNKAKVLGLVICSLLDMGFTASQISRAAEEMEEN